MTGVLIYTLSSVFSAKSTPKICLEKPLILYFSIINTIKKEMSNGTLHKLGVPCIRRYAAKFL